MRQTPKNVSPFSNEARNTYVLEHITQSMLKLLHEKKIEDISISEICDDAGVGRASFYRNFESKDEIIQKHLCNMMQNWKESYDRLGKDSGAEMYGNLFAYLKDNADYFLLLKKQNLLHLFLYAYLGQFNPKPEDPNMWAYTKAFIAYGTYGWVEEWINRGMQESAETMATLLSQNGMK